MNVRRWFGLGLVIFGIMLANPPFIPSPDDFLNFVIASAFTAAFGCEPILALLLTYTLIPLILVSVGVVVIPEPVNKTLKWVHKKIRGLYKAEFKWFFGSPINFVIGACFIVLLLFAYYILLKGFI